MRLDEGEFHVRVYGAEEGEAVYGDGPADRADARIALDVEVCLELARGGLTLAEAVEGGRVEVSGDGPLAAALRGE